MTLNIFSSTKIQVAKKGFVSLSSLIKGAKGIGSNSRLDAEHVIKNSKRYSWAPSLSASKSAAILGSSW